MRSRLNKHLLFFLSIGIILTSIFGCDMLQSMLGSNKLYFCDRYVAESDFCEGEANTFSIGSVTVMAKLKDPVNATEVVINVKEKNTGNTVNNFPFNVTPDMKYIHFKGVAFTAPGTYTVTLVRDGADVVSSDVEITD